MGRGKECLQVAAVAAFLALGCAGCASPSGTAQATSARLQDGNFRLSSPDLNDRPGLEFRDVVSEIRLGALRNDVGVFGASFEEGDNANLELLFQAPEDFLEVIGSPRPHLGTSVNTLGYTSQAYAGLTWRFDVVSDVVFLGLGFGAALHDGELEPQYEDRKALGSRMLFREAVEIGAQITERQSLSIILDHVSNARLAEYNEGLDTFGIRYGFRF